MYRDLRQLLVALDDRPFGLVLEGHLTDAEHGERVDHAEHHREDEEGAERDEELTEISVHQCTPSAVTTMSMSLMKMKGATTPPTP
jgi:hypothetical protein